MRDEDVSQRLTSAQYWWVLVLRPAVGPAWLTEPLQTRAGILHGRVFSTSQFSTGFFWKSGIPCGIPSAGQENSMEGIISYPGHVGRALGEACRTPELGQGWWVGY